MNFRVAVLVSAGRHPVTGRPRRSPLDARALELALGLPGARLEVFHAGDPLDGALRCYLGMGLERICVLALADQSNPYPALARALAERNFDLVLTGTNNIDGVGTGFVPYSLARDLGFPVIGSACQLSLHRDRVEVVQSMPKGKRRIAAARLPAVVTVGNSGPKPRQSAYGPARRGIVEEIPGHHTRAASAPPWTVKPAKAVPPRLQPFARGASASERLAAIMESRHKSGAVLTGLSPKAGAETLLDYLASENVLTDAPRPDNQGENE